MQSEKELVKRIIPSMKPYFPEEDIREILTACEEIIRSGKLTLGTYALSFEKEFAKYIGVKHAIATNSGTSSLEAILRAIDVTGKEVITPTNTHIATSNSVIYAGGVPVLSDIEESTLCLDLDNAFSRITSSSKGVIVVHVAGLVHPKIDEISKRCKELGLSLIEDAAHAHGASIDSRKAGSLSIAGSFSFYPAKVITSIEGGMITTNSSEIEEIVRELRNHGTDPATGVQVRLGYNWRMSELHSVIGLVQLRRIEEIISHKGRIARAYESMFSDNEMLSIIKVPAKIRHSYYKYPIVLSRNIKPDRVRTIMKDRYGIETGSIYYPPCHLQPIYQEIFAGKLREMKVSEDILKRTLTLPIFAALDEPSVTYISESLLASVRESKKDY